MYVLLPDVLPFRMVVCNYNSFLWKKLRRSFLFIVEWDMMPSKEADCSFVWSSTLSSKIPIGDCNVTSLVSWAFSRLLWLLDLPRFYLTKLPFVSERFELLMALGYCPFFIFALGAFDDTTSLIEFVDSVFTFGSLLFITESFIISPTSRYLSFCGDTKPSSLLIFFG